VTRGIVQLWEIKDFQDCWVLHRSLLDRLFHLRALNERDEFDEFEAWSFKKQYEAVARLKSDPDAAYVVGTAVFEPKPEQHLRYKALAKCPSTESRRRC
jgi:hypothetical protein